MSLSEKRRNEIAWVMIQQMVKDTGISNFDPDKILAEMQKKIEGTGISLEEGQEFSRELIMPLVDKAFPKPEADEKVISLISKASSTG